MSQSSSTPPAGQAEITAFVRDCWQRGKAARPLPVIVLLGRPGSGKTHALDHLARQGARFLTARVDFGPRGVQRPYETARHLAFLLARKHDSVHAPRFPRLMLGLLAVSIPPLSRDNRVVARRELKEALNSSRSGELAQTAEGAAEAIESLGLVPSGIPVPLPLLAGLLLRGVRRLPSSAAFNPFLKSALKSFGNDSAPAGFDALIDLNHLHHGGIPEDAKDVDRTLCQAFLDDLGAAFAGGDRLYHCLVLLDNIGSPHGTPFLELLVDLRQERASRGAYDPLLVVATGATTRVLPESADGSGNGTGLRIFAPGQLSYGAWRPRPDAPPPSWWCPVLLRDLTETEVAREAAEFEAARPAATGHPAQRVLRGTAPLVHRLTYGHPWSVSTLHRYLAGIRAEGPTDDDLRGLLQAHPQGAQSDPSLAEVIRRRLLSGFTADQRQAAAFVAAARTPRAAVNAGLLNDRPEHARDTLMRELRDRLWLSARVPEDAHTRGGRGPSGYLLPTRRADSGRTTDHTYDEQPVLHPWLRLLLLDELAEVPGGSVDRWTRLHDDLAQWHKDQHQPLDELYHLLANNQLDTVVSRFLTGLNAGDLVPWLRELYHVTAAPMYTVHLSDASPQRLAGELAHDYAPRAYTDPARGRPLAELCAALWLAGDPRRRLPAGAPELNHKIGAMFRQVAMVAGADATSLLAEAVRYTD
ncbi:ATP-binding protein [Streptomyces sp. NPDC054863]